MLLEPTQVQKDKSEVHPGQFTKPSDGCLRIINGQSKLLSLDTPEKWLFTRRSVNYTFLEKKAHSKSPKPQPNTSVNAYPPCILVVDKQQGKAVRISTLEDKTQEFLCKCMKNVKHKLRSCLLGNMLSASQMLSSHGRRSENTHKRRGKDLLYFVVQQNKWELIKDTLHWQSLIKSTTVPHVFFNAMWRTYVFAPLPIL